MESVKSTLAAMLLHEFGPGCVLELDTVDRCFKLQLPVSADHVIYVQPDALERHFLCHYAHKADLVDDLEWEKNGDALAWKQQNVAQLPRRLKARMEDFASAVMWYARQAAARIESMKGLGGRRTPVAETFAEARARLYYFPEPKEAEVIGQNPLKRKRAECTKQAGRGK
jgi:hypothetical protein